MSKNHAWEEQIRMKILIRKIFPTRKLCLCALDTILTGEKNVRRNGVIMRRRWGLRGGACLLTCMLLTGCVGTAEETGTDSVGQAQEETVEAVDNDTEKTYYALPTEAEESEIYVEPVEGLSEDFIRGVDISSVLAEEKSGVVYYNEAGEEQDIFRTLAESGVNYIRVRVWNDPYDEQGNSYGGGNCDVSTAAEIGRRAAQYGMKLCVDFHYSDFWADPAKQMCPKAWKDDTVEEKADALYAFTKDSLTEILDAGAEVGMVQIGNEINYGMAGETDWSKRVQLLAVGSKAVREIATDREDTIRIAVHFTDISDKDSILAIAEKLQQKQLDYDVFAVSYYPFWHGTQENLVAVLKGIAEGYDKEVMVAENSYFYTGEDGDGSANSIGTDQEVENYTVSVQGQANEIRDICAAVASVGEAGIGYFYWEPAWIPVHYYDKTAADAASVLAANKESWEKDGSGWASSYAGEYDPKDAGAYYGGSSWDNQALFDFTGHPLASLKVFRYLYHGTITEKHVYSVEDVTIPVGVGEEVVLPDTVNVVYNDGSVGQAAVDWDIDKIAVDTEDACYMVAALDTSKGGEYEITGSFPEDSGDELKDFTVTAVVSVTRQNLIANASFEESDYSMWQVISEGASVTDYQDKESDAYSGNLTLHFWSEKAFSFTVEQTIEGLEPGTYECGFYIQGGDVGTDAEMYLFAETGDGRQEEATAVSGWCNWQNPQLSEVTVGADGTITVGAYISSGPGGWGTLDDFYLYRVE